MKITQRPAELAAPTLTAAATPITPTTGTYGKIGTNNRSDWKNRAWHYFDTIGELGYVCEWISASLSRVKIIPSAINPSTGQPTLSCDDEQVNQIVTDIAGGPAGQAAMLRRLATGLTVPGEAWIAVILRDVDGAPMEEWHILSADEIIDRSGDVTLKLQDGTDHVFNVDTDLLFRVHRPHPRNSRDSFSLTRSAMPILAEIERTTAAIDGAGKSRLAGNGLLLVPQEISAPKSVAPRAQNPDAPGLEPQEQVTVDQPVTATDIMQQLQQVMTTAIRDQTSAAALVPIVLKAPGETLDKIRHIKLDSEVTQTNLETRDRAIRRLALSLDVPAEVLTGMSQGNHWSAWTIDEASVKSHIVPLMVVICDALTEAVLRPLLRSAGHPNPEQFTVWFDESPLLPNPNRTQYAVNAFDRGVINGATLRRELGFEDEDAVRNDEESQRELAIRIVSGAPSLLPLLADVIGIPLADVAPAQADDTTTAPATSEPEGNPNTPPAPEGK